MYSVILAALITTGTEQTQAWHHCHGCSCSCSCSCWGGGCWSGHGGYAFWPSCSCSGCWCSGCSCSCSCSCSCFGCSSCSCSGPALWTVGYSHWCTGCYGSWCSGYAGTGWTFYSGPTFAGGVCAGDVTFGVAAVGSVPSYYAQESTPVPMVAAPGRAGSCDRPGSRRADVGSATGRGPHRPGRVAGEGGRDHSRRREAVGRQGRVSAQGGDALVQHRGTPAGKPILLQPDRRISRGDARDASHRADAGPDDGSRLPKRRHGQALRLLLPLPALGERAGVRGAPLRRDLG